MFGVQRWASTLANRSNARHRSNIRAPPPPTPHPPRSMYSKCGNLCGRRGRKRFIASWGLRMSSFCPPLLETYDWLRPQHAYWLSGREPTLIGCSAMFGVLWLVETPARILAVWTLAYSDRLPAHKENIWFYPIPLSESGEWAIDKHAPYLPLQAFFIHLFIYLLPCPCVPDLRTKSIQYILKAYTVKIPSTFTFVRNFFLSATRIND
jgi:hypothetical protein